MKPKNKEIREGLLPMLLILLFFCSIVWINFHSALWYQSDVYTYSYEGFLMHQEKTCFPDHWIFGNQYHIISSPNLSAIVYGLFHDSTMSMAMASSLSSLLILLAFIWCIAPFCSKQGLLLGVLSIVGGIIFGISASSYVAGLQVLHTMSSFYACYLIGLLVSVGCWLRIKEKKKLSWPMVLLAIALNFALGMQSLREMLILVIPLLLLDGIIILSRIILGETVKDTLRDSKTLYLSVSMLLAELVGILVIKAMDVPACPIIEDIHFDFSPSRLASHFWIATKSILRVSGIAIAKEGIQYLPLSICALIVAIIVLWTIYKIIRNKDNSPLAAAILFCLLSVLCVYGVGIFLMETRSIYYFIYWPLAALSIIYFIQTIPIQYKKGSIYLFCAICGINYGFTFIPDFADYQAFGKELEQVSDELSQQGVRVIYTDASPIFAAASKDRIFSQSYWLDVKCDSGYPLTVFPSDKHTVLFDDAHYQDALICFTNYTLYAIHSDELKEYREFLFSKLDLIQDISFGKRHFMLYKPRNGERIIEPI